jgi:cellulose synthase/poly-beta-1,6-N-acetylglucosamine synthase-like glycosyltransferase
VDILNNSSCPVCGDTPAPRSKCDPPEPGGGTERSLTITVLVPTFRRSKELDRCLQSLAAQERLPDEVVVVVREPDQETQRVLQDRPTGELGLRHVTVSAPGVVAALTVGLNSVRTDLVAITDDDVIAPRDWLTRVERHFRDDATVGAVGGRDWVHAGDGVLDGARREVGKVRWYGRVIGNHHLGVGDPRPVDVLKGANMSFRTRALDETRPDKSLKGQGAQVHFELGLCLALARRKWKILYDPSLAVHHYPASRFDEDARDAPSLRALAYAAHNELYLLLRWLPVWRKPFALAYALLVGSRRGPGVVILVERLARERNPAAVTARARAAQRGRVAAISTLLAQRGRRQAGPRKSD